MRIPNEIIPEIYRVSKLAYEQKISLTQGAESLFEISKVNINSAKDYINNFRYLMEGKVFKRTLNAYSMSYFLSNIFKDYGVDQLRLSLQALKLHITYYESCHASPLNKLRAIHKKFEKIYTNNIG